MPVIEKKGDSGVSESLDLVKESILLELEELEKTVKSEKSNSRESARLELKESEKSVEAQVRFKTIFDFIKSNGKERFGQALIQGGRGEVARSWGISFFDSNENDIVLQCSEGFKGKRLTIFKGKSKYSLENHDGKFELSYAGNRNALKAFLDPIITQQKHQKELTDSEVLSILDNFMNRVIDYKGHQKQRKQKKLNESQKYAYENGLQNAKSNTINQIDDA